MIRKLIVGFLIYLIGGFPTLVFALPQGGEVVSGTVGINSPNANNMAINQGSDQAIVNWQGFDIGQQESVTINQPSNNSVILNRVVGENPSSILGKLSANGQVFLTNPSGILFGQGAQVNVGALVASTLNISNQDFLDRNYRFTQDANKPLASIINLGDINAGSVGLVAPRVENRGTIVASLGSVAIASGEKTALDFEGDGLINFEITEPVSGEIRDSDGNVIQSGVINSGLIQANGGRVVLSASQAQGMIQSVVNNEGMIEAKGVEERDGKIFLLGADEIINEGTLDVSGNEPGQTGGEIRLLGEEVSIKGGILNASGDAGGGTILIGGDRQGQNSNIQNAQNTTVAESAKIHADAIRSGDGGKIIIWADDSTIVHGSISATGGAQSGDGGFVETSGKNSLVVTSAPNVSAKNGQAGTWLLDPTNIEIVSGPGNGDGSQVSVTTIETALNAGTSVHIVTSGQGLEEGTITVSTAIVKSSGGDTSLTLTAHGDIIVNQSIASTSGTLDVNLVSGADIFVNAAIVTNGGNVLADAGSTNLPANISGSYMPAARISGAAVELPKIEISADITTGGGSVTLGEFKTKQHSLIGGGTFTKEKHAVTDVTVQTSSINTGGGDFKINGSAITVASTATVTSPGGSILIESTSEAIVGISGVLNAANAASSQTGGTIHVLGYKVGLFDNAVVDASGDAGGGIILIGGDFQGKNDEIKNAYRTYVGTDVVIKADATNTGDGGKVIVWADDTTRFYGDIFARGGSISGDGGFVETSGKNFLDAQGYVNTLAVNGNVGTWLLDPTDITVVNGGGAALTGVDQFADSSGSSVTIDAATINVASTNVTLQASNDIIINEAISISTSGVTLTLQAGRSVLINQNITTNNAALTIVANETQGNGVEDANRAAGTAVIAMADGTTLNSGTADTILTMSTGPTTNNTSGSITIENITATHVQIVNNGATSGSRILRASADSLITATSASLDAVSSGASIGSSGSSIRVTLTNLDARATSAGVFIESIGQGLTIGGANLGALTGISTTSSGVINVTAAGSITISEAMSGTAAVTLDANGTNADVNVNAVITTGSGGAINITADDSVVFAAAGDITASGAGNVLIQSNTNTTDGDGTDGIIISDGALIDAGSGTISLISTGTNAGNITLGGLTTTNATSSAISVQSDAEITDSGNVHVDAVAASGTINLVAATGMGVTGGNGSIDITTAKLVVDSNQSIVVNSSTTLTDLTITLDPGSTSDTYTITDGGNLTLTLTDSGSDLDIGGLTVSSGTLNFALNIDTGNLTTSGDIGVAGGGAVGNLSITTTSGNQTYSNTAKGSGSVNISAASGTLTVNSTKQIIASGSSDLTVSAAGVSLAGSSSVTENLQNSGTGGITITSTGAITFAGDFSIGVAGTGTLTIDAGSNSITTSGTGTSDPDIFLNGGNFRIIGTSVGTSTHFIRTSGLTDFAGTSTAGGFYVHNFGSSSTINSNTIGSSVGIAAMGGDVHIKNTATSSGFIFTQLISSSTGRVTLESTAGMSDNNGTDTSISAVNETIVINITGSGDFGSSGNPIEISAKGRSITLASGTIFETFTNTTPAEETTTETTTTTDTTPPPEPTPAADPTPPGDIPPEIIIDIFGSNVDPDKVNNDKDRGNFVGFVEAVKDIVKGSGC